jgi:basic membrane protein A and related proteins
MEEKRMSFKRLFVVLVLLAVLVTACSPAATVAPTTAPAATSAPAATTAPAAKAFRIAVVMPSAITDVAFSQSMWDALQSVQKEMGGASALEIKYTENMFNVPDAAAAIRDYASQGFDVVIAHGSQYGTSVQEVAKDFPKVTFAWGTDVNTFGMANVYAYTAAAEEGGYVNGVLAAKLTKSKTIGVTGPVEVGDAKTYIDGFGQGVASVDPSIKVSKTWTGSFSDVALMTEAAKTHIAAGADILTGSSQSVVGSIGAAKDKGTVLWFGTQADQSSLAPQLVVASQVYDWTGMLKDIIAKHKAGTLGGDKYVLQLKNGGLKVAYNAGYTLPADVKAAGDAAIDGIKSGKITVTP